MHVVGARFPDVESADAALQAIRAGVAVAPGDAGMRALGSTRYEEPATDFLVAGRFEAADVEAVLAIMERHGGAVLSRRAEWPNRVQRTGTPPTTVPATAGLRSNSGSGLAASPRGQIRAAARRPRAAGKRRRRPAAPLRVRAARDRRGSR